MEEEWDIKWPPATEPLPPHLPRQPRPISGSISSQMLEPGRHPRAQREPRQVGTVNAAAGHMLAQRDAWPLRRGAARHRPPCGWQRSEGGVASHAPRAGQQSWVRVCNRIRRNGRQSIVAATWPSAPTRAIPTFSPSEPVSSSGLFFFLGGTYVVRHALVTVSEVW